MPIHVDWYLLHHVIRERVWGHATQEDLNQHFDACKQMLAEAYTLSPQNKVHLLVDARDAESLTPLYLAVDRGSQILQFKNRGTLFLVTRNRAVRTVVELTARIGGTHFPLRVFNEHEAALEALTSYLAQDTLRATQGRTATKPADSDL